MDIQDNKETNKKYNIFEIGIYGYIILSALAWNEGLISLFVGKPIILKFILVSMLCCLIYLILIIIQNFFKAKKERKALYKQLAIPSFAFALSFFYSIDVLLLLIAPHVLEAFH